MAGSTQSGTSGHEAVTAVVVVSTREVLVVGGGTTVVLVATVEWFVVVDPTLPPHAAPRRPSMAMSGPHLVDLTSAGSLRIHRRNRAIGPSRSVQVVRRPATRTPTHIPVNVLAGWCVEGV
jgi:hypothetical protein